MIVMIDNYDSFTYNIVQEMGKIGARMDVFRNDSITVKELKEIKPVALIRSQVPGTPTKEVISI